MVITLVYRVMSLITTILPIDDTSVVSNATDFKHPKLMLNKATLTETSDSYKWNENSSP